MTEATSTGFDEAAGLNRGALDVRREVEVNLGDLRFSAAHFVASRGVREALHGHNYTFAVKLGTKEVNADGYLVDFGDIKRAARSACKKLNSLTLVPTESDVLTFRFPEPDQLEILCEDGARFLIPTADCAMLPIVHSTAEELAEYLWGELVRELETLLRERKVTWMEVMVSERPGQGARFRRALRSGDVPIEAAMVPPPPPPFASSTSTARSKRGGLGSLMARGVASVGGTADGCSCCGALPISFTKPADHAVETVETVESVGEAAYRMLLSTLGEAEASRPELIKTPARAAKAFREITVGLTFDNPLDAAGDAVFPLEGSSDLVVVKDIPFHSICEHHLLPFTGTAHIAYIPSGRILGLSKFARLTDAFARRPQVQERLTRQIAEGIDQLLQPVAVAVVMEARHMCMSMRGVKSPGVTRTLSVKGASKDDLETRRMLLRELGPGQSKL